MDWSTGAGGNLPGATIPPDKTFADLDFAAFQQVVDVNLHGTVLPSLVFTPGDGGGGPRLGWSTSPPPPAARALTRVVGYSAAKAAVENFTRWLAVDLARRTAGAVRVNAVLPGFFIGEQNRRLLTPTKTAHSPTGVLRSSPKPRLDASERRTKLHGALHYLLADASRFVTGTILPVDGGFGAFSGV